VLRHLASYALTERLRKQSLFMRWVLRSGPGWSFREKIGAAQIKRAAAAV
jgi:hypothetical protein